MLLLNINDIEELVINSVNEPCMCHVHQICKINKEYLRALFPIRATICSQYVSAIYKNHTRDLGEAPFPPRPWTSHFKTNHSI